MDAIGAGGDRDIGAGIDEQAGARGRLAMKNLKYRAGELGEVVGREVLLAKLEEIDVGFGALKGLMEQGLAAGGLGVCEADTIRNGVAKHGYQCRAF